MDWQSRNTEVSPLRLRKCAKASVEMTNVLVALPQGLKPGSQVAFSARLKPCP
jgi:hypothetical protein